MADEDENEEGDHTATADDNESNADPDKEAAVQQGVDELRKNQQKGVRALSA